jgi:hypothetical protein
MFQPLTTKKGNLMFSEQESQMFYRRGSREKKSPHTFKYVANLYAGDYNEHVCHRNKAQGQVLQHIQNGSKQTELTTNKAFHIKE